MASLPSWKRNLERSGGFGSNPAWYDLHLNRRMPLALPMLEEMLMALPPLPPGATLCDLACGTGNAAASVLEAYPQVDVWLIDKDPDLLAMAEAKVDQFTPHHEAIRVTVDPEDDSGLPGGPYDVVLASLALHAIVGHDAEPAEAALHYELLLRSIRESLAPGGHLIVGDHVGTLPLYDHLKAMDRAGFSDVDCAWRQDDFFVAGGRVAG
jgi:trans-aconitate methyltransferase